MASVSTGILSQITVVPYGVLGKSNRGIGGPEPDAETAFVDPAGLYYIQQGGPRGAGGAAGVIYQWLGISNDAQFPTDVVETLTGELAAKFHAYGDKKCIHVVGPDFRSRSYTREGAVSELAMAYLNVFEQLYESGLQKLRLLPVSGGIFSGSFAREIPAMTAEALEEGLTMLPSDVTQFIRGSQIEMCIFQVEQVEEFVVAFGGQPNIRLSGSTASNPTFHSADPYDEDQSHAWLWFKIVSCGIVFLGVLTLSLILGPRS